eukprot:14577210-Heterocapsa_arctica.AAC.1
MEHLTPSGLLADQEAATAGHQMARCSPPASPPLHSGHSPNSLGCALQQNCLSAGGHAGNASRWWSSSSTPVGPSGRVQFQASRESGDPAHSWHHAMPV